MCVDTRQMSVLATEDICLVSTADICPVSAADTCPVSRADTCPVSTEDIYPVSTEDITAAGRRPAAVLFSVETGMSFAGGEGISSKWLHQTSSAWWFGGILFDFFGQGRPL